MHHRTPEISERLRAALNHFHRPKCCSNGRANNARFYAQR